MQKIAIMSGGTTQKEDLFYNDLFPLYDFTIAVDMGANVFFRLKRKPNVIIGDLDSISKETLIALEKSGVCVQRFSVDKNKSDTELALDFAYDRGFLEVDILGGIGSRLDHTISNLYLLTYANRKKMNVRLINPWHEVQLLKAHNKVKVQGVKGNIVSLVPITKKIEGLKICGCRWELSNATIERGTTHTISNELENEIATISINKGMAFIFKVSE